MKIQTPLMITREYGKRNNLPYLIYLFLSDGVNDKALFFYLHILNYMLIGKVDSLKI
jgi:hypothetical protein